jgi:hypothetical protein
MIVVLLFFNILIFDSSVVNLVFNDVICDIFELKFVTIDLSIVILEFNEIMLEKQLSVIFVKNTLVLFIYVSS